MKVFHLTLVLQETLFYATRELGRLVETGSYLHNYALAYALGYVNSPVRICGRQPSYEKDLKGLTIYVTPAKPIKVSYGLERYAARSEFLRTVKTKEELNIPEYGFHKVILPESAFQCFLFSKGNIEIPKYVRLGKNSAKAKIDVEPCDVKVIEVTPPLIISFPLNPRDLSVEPTNYEEERMLPNSLYTKTAFDVHEALSVTWTKGLVYLPTEMNYFASRK